MSRQIEISNHYRQACEAYQANLIKRQRDSFWEISYVRYALALMICTLCGNNFFEQKIFRHELCYAYNISVLFAIC